MITLGPFWFAFLSTFAFLGFVGFVAIVIAGIVAAVKKK